MKIKRFVAATMREALACVRAEQGPDAVIIANRRCAGGIELITAIDYDETLIEQALQRARPEPLPGAATAAAAPPSMASTSMPAAPSAPAPPAQRAGRPAPAPPSDARPRVVWSQEAEVVAMRREIESLRRLLEDQLASLAWSDRLRREPARAAVLRDLSRLGIAPDVARWLAERVPADADAGEPFRLPLALLMKHLPTVDDGLLAAGGTFAVVGPTGVGKTTTIAKLAARYALEHGADGVALVSLDHHRIGARDQLLTYARILGVPMHVATSARELAAVLTRLANCRLVLVDTAGMSPRDDRLAAQFAMLAVRGARPIRTLLALAANADLHALDEVVRSYAPARPEALLLTKLDEAATYGPALSVAIRHALPLAQLCDGQRVPQDLHAAPRRRVWLVKSAVKLARAARGRVDDNYMAEHFGKVAANG
jgi:flagellar biosynthesis protein FlhF